MAEPVGFFGREGELSRLLGALRGDVRLALVVGDAGVGKTRLVVEAMAQAAAGGMVIARGECLPLADALPLLPVADALGELGRLEGGRLLAAALDATPGYVRAEVGRLLPGLGRGDGVAGDGRDGEWSQGRLFSAVEELLAAVAGRSSGVGVVVEDVHWGDKATLDCLTFLSRSGRHDVVTVVVTCRSDEAPVSAHVAGWLAAVRGTAGVEEIRLGPLPHAETAQQVAALTGGPVPAQVARELYARAEGNPFFTEQLVAAALTYGAEQGLRVPTEVPGRLAELLTARADRCTGDARVLLAGLAVASRPLAEGLLGAVTGLDPPAVREGLRELAAARLLAEDTAEGGHRPRHALLGEAVAARLLPGERAALHERTARALAAAGDQALAAEVAGHWQAAGRPAEELPARISAAGAAERVFGYSEAAAHWQRAIELCLAFPDAAASAGLDLPRLYVQAADAFHLSGDTAQAGMVAEEAYRRFAGYTDPAIAAAICHQTAFFRPNAAAGRPLWEQAFQLFEQAPPSHDHAYALFDYATTYLLFVEGRFEPVLPALTRALQIAEAAGDTAIIPRILSMIAYDAFVRGQVEGGFALLERGWALARAALDGPAQVWLAITESDAWLKLGQFQRAAEVASHGFDAAQQAGLQAWYGGATLAANAAEALLAQGRTAEAAGLIDPLTAGPPSRDGYLLHVARAEVDLLRGDTGAPADRWQPMTVSLASLSRLDEVYEAAQRAAEVALWTERPGEALDKVQQVLPRINTPDLTIFCGRLLVTGMRACADLAGQARARRDQPAAIAAAAAADGLVTWVERLAGAAFTDHPFVATIPSERATWDGERARLAGTSNPGVWGAAVKAWQDLGCPHRAAYASWRQAEALLDAGQPATAAAGPLRAAAEAAGGHAPLLAQIRMLAGRARVPLPSPTASAPAAPPPAEARVLYGLTGRELAVLRLLVAGRSNAQIGAELYISPKTAGVHVSSILRKLGVSGRVQAAAVAERGGLLDL